MIKIGDIVTVQADPFFAGVAEFENITSKTSRRW